MAALLRAAGVSRTAAKAMQQTRGYKVAVLGAAGGIGQPCGLLMKMVRLRSHLAIAQGPPIETPDQTRPSPSIGTCRSRVTAN